MSTWLQVLAGAVVGLSVNGMSPVRQELTRPMSIRGIVGVSILGLALGEPPQELGSRRLGLLGDAISESFSFGAERIFLCDQILVK